ncbi:Sir2 silent information regulator family NAD-dependent deacetylase [Prevotella sp. A2931]|uniref:Sir2 silent information regulator family NAD-dependent deacetylase n=1 Tax=Prevotella illustrans TaxID=2800387 RepID=A0ABS3M617_9BACT|nr:MULTISPECIES: Sir2 silent information regulator family NAD-dependent deacetylase [Prevotella]MBO1363618.1 Sir2 silent information regulator family NAD-dependent deacetylase [Prevotella illustrans]PTL27203.1 Sir2 silent information regulator family NAD-dependent deacetylase [Prevotella sp. oral taxon 820]
MKYTDNFSERIEFVRSRIAEVDYILIGAGAGLSAAAGLAYSGAEFERVFRPWINRYGISDLYTSSFYPFETEEERWAYWAWHIWFARFRPEGTELYRKLLRLVEGKPHFVITTNVDAQFVKSGFMSDKVFAPQGDYAYLQARSGRPQTLVYDEPWVREAMAATHDCEIPATLVPRHPQTGELMSPNLRCDETFVEDENWHRQARAYQDFVERAQDSRLLLLEFGVGFNTPTIIRFPFERMAASCPQTTLVRFNRDEPQPILEHVRNFTGFTERLDDVMDKLLSARDSEFALQKA